MLLFTLPGTPIFHAGDEIGMPNAEIPPDRVRDPFELMVPGYGLNRDPERAPMRWDAGKNSGFTTGKPWLPLADQIEDRNVATQLDDERSVVWLYHRLIRLRQQEPALLAGRFEPQRSQSEVLLYERRLDRPGLCIALNIGDRDEIVQLCGDFAVLLSSYLDRADGLVHANLRLRPAEGVILRRP